MKTIIMSEKAARRALHLVRWMAGAVTDKPDSALLTEGADAIEAGLGDNRGASSEMVTLKPCPFCGDPMEWHYDVDGFMHSPHSTDIGKCYLRHTYYHRGQLDWWNERTPISPVTDGEGRGVQMVRDLIEGLEDLGDLLPILLATDEAKKLAALLAKPSSEHPLSGEVERVAQDRADWLLDAIACATQDRRYLRGDPEYDEVVGEAILSNGEKAIQTAIAAMSSPSRDGSLFERMRAVQSQDGSEGITDALNGLKKADARGGLGFDAHDAIRKAIDVLTALGSKLTS